MSHSNRTWVVDTPFIVAPDATSIVQIAPLRSHIMLVANTWSTVFLKKHFGQRRGEGGEISLMKVGDMIVFGEFRFLSCSS